jgi:hypothetical protein
VSASGKSCPQGEGSGTLEDPYCKVQKGLDAGASQSRAVIVLGGVYGEAVNVEPAGGASYTVTAIGVHKPTIAPIGTAPAVTLANGGTAKIDVTLDGFDFKGAGAEGVHCGGSAMNVAATRLTLLRSTIRESAGSGIGLVFCDATLDRDTIGPRNQGGGIDLVSSDFTLTNTLVFKNGSPSTEYGGICVRSVVTRREIVNVTVVSNASSSDPTAVAGLRCEAPPVIVNSVFFGNQGPSISPDLNAVSDPNNPGGCHPDYSAFPGAVGTNEDLQSCRADGLFVAPATDDYHPNKGGAPPCSLVDVGTNTVGLDHDLDGTARPQPAGGTDDIGAYEAK